LTVGVVVVVLLVVGIFVLVDKTTSQAVKVSNLLVADIQGDNPRAAYAPAAPAFHAATTESQLAQIIAQVSPALEAKTDHGW
jgi:hypothetical protein